MDRLASHDARSKLPHHRDICHPRFPGGHSLVAMFIQRKNGGLTLILLSILMLLVGGGFIPPLFGIIAGVIGSYRKSKQGVCRDQFSIRIQ